MFYHITPVISKRDCGGAGEESNLQQGPRNPCCLKSFHGSNPFCSFEKGKSNGKVFIWLVGFHRLIVEAENYVRYCKVRREGVAFYAFFSRFYVFFFPSLKTETQFKVPVYSSSQIDELFIPSRTVTAHCGREKKKKG